MKVQGLDSIEGWKMNLMAVSEKYKIVVIAVESKLNVYKLDPISGKVKKAPCKVIDLVN